MTQAINTGVAQSAPPLTSEKASLSGKYFSHPLAGTRLPVDAASSEREVHEISVEMLPPQHAKHVVNFADNFDEGWLDSNSNQLRLKFHLLTVFSNAKVDELWLSIPGEDKRIALSPTCIASPVIGQKYSELRWAAQSRFVVNEIIELPDWANTSAQFELFAGVADKSEKIGVIRVGEVFKSLDGHNDLAIPASMPASAAMPKPAIERHKTFPVSPSGAIEQVKGMNRLFLITVVLPTLISIIYFGLIASDVYISESRFVVRSPQRQTNSTLGSLIQGVGFSHSQEDSYAVHDFIFSRDALKQLDGQFALAKEFSSSDIDVFSRFAGLDRDDSFEALYLYFQKHVTLDLDTSSSISTLSVRAFSPETAYQINEKLLGMSEALVNRLNERGKQDMIRFASEEVARAEQRTKAATLAVSNYRNQKGVFDPEGQSTLQLQQVSKIQDDLIASKIQLAQILSQAKDNPQIRSLQKRIEALQAQSDAETAKVVGGDRSLSHKSPGYESLELERGFAEKQLAAALTSLVQARNDAERQQLYLERIDQPSKPDVAMEPRRLRAILTTLILGFIAWGVSAILLAGVREHKD